MLRIEKLTVVTNNGGAGTSSGSTQRTGSIYGYVEWIYIDYSASQAATADYTITCEQGNVSIPILVKANSATDTFYYPRAVVHKNTDATASTDFYDKIAVSGELKAAVAQGNAVVTDNVYICVNDGK